ncbi:MAG: hypothetical protein ACYSU7_01980 [Planctomycetota bacterium]|jgi:hypothetical protein
MRHALRIGMALVAVSLFHGTATAANQDEFTLVFVMTPTGERTVVNAVLEHNRPLSTGQNYWVIHVVPHGENAEEYDILFGPDPQTTTNEAGAGIIRDSAAGDTHQELGLESGIAYYIGSRPYGGSDGGSGVGEGTIFVIHARPIDEDGRFIFLDTEGTATAKLTVHSRAPSPTPPSVVVDKVNKHVQVPDDGDLSAVNPKKVRGKQSIRNLLWEVVKLVDLAGLGRPLPY